MGWEGLAGSPPRAWGQQQRRPILEPASRFTPTGVGTTRILPLRSRPGPVHPHGRGDNQARMPGSSWASGSPPRAWGQLPRQKKIIYKRRFTPTGVGTTCIMTSHGKAFAVHPHGRGDNRSLAVLGGLLGGSPPRAWGQLLNRSRYVRCQRFTPTGVGTT